MRFWDSSAIVPLLIREATSERIEALYSADPEVAVWWGTRLECVSATTRRERETGLRPERAKAALARLNALGAAWTQVEPSEQIREAAERAIRSHQLHAADALQLAAAIAVAEDDRGSLEFVCLDTRLVVAAEREGFAVAHDV